MTLKLDAAGGLAWLYATATASANRQILVNGDANHVAQILGVAGTSNAQLEDLSSATILANCVKWIWQYFEISGFRN